MLTASEKGADAPRDVSSSSPRRRTRVRPLGMEAGHILPGQPRRGMLGMRAPVPARIGIALANRDGVQRQRFRRAPAKPRDDLAIAGHVAFAPARQARLAAGQSSRGRSRARLPRPAAMRALAEGRASATLRLWGACQQRTGEWPRPVLAGALCAHKPSSLRAARATRSRRSAMTLRPCATRAFASLPAWPRPSQCRAVLRLER